MLPSPPGEVAIASSETGRTRLWDGAGHGAALSLRQADLPHPAVEFAEDFPPGGPSRVAQLWVRVPDTSVAALSAVLEGVLARSAPDAGEPVVLDGPGRQLVEIVEDLFAAGTFAGSGPAHWCWTVADWCKRAGVPFEVYSAAWDGSRQPTMRWHPLHRVRTPGGHMRTLALEFHPDSRVYRYGIRFRESYQPEETAAHPDDRWEHAVGADYSALATLATFFASELAEPSGELAEPPGELEDRLIAGLAALVGQGRLGGAGPPRRDRDQVRDWWQEAGVAYALDGDDRRRRLAELGPPALDHVCTLELIIHANGTRPTITFVEWRRPAEGGTGDPYQVTAPLAALPALVAYLTDRWGAVPQRPVTGEPDEERLFACFEALVAAGELGPAPRRRIRDRVAQWFTAAGVDATVYGHDRKERLLKAYREPQDCVFTLSLILDPAEDRIAFLEDYEYLPRPGDPGREYGYSAETPYAALATLVEFLGYRIGTPPASGGDPEDTLVACFAALVARGELADGEPLKANRDRVAAWFTEAGLVPESSSSGWINSD